MTLSRPPTKAERIFAAIEEKALTSPEWALAYATLVQARQVEYLGEELQGLPTALEAIAKVISLG